MAGKVSVIKWNFNLTGISFVNKMLSSPGVQLYKSFLKKSPFKAAGECIFY